MAPVIPLNRPCFEPRFARLRRARVAASSAWRTISPGVVRTLSATSYWRCFQVGALYLPLRSPAAGTVSFALSHNDTVEFDEEILCIHEDSPCLSRIISHPYCLKPFMSYTAAA